MGSVKEGIKTAKEGISSWWKSSVEGFQSGSFTQLAGQVLEASPSEAGVVAIAGAMRGGGKLAAVLKKMTAAEEIATDVRAASGAVYKTTKEATKAAEELGFSKINETIHGQAVFKRRRDFITRDIDGCNGAAWKMAESVKDLASKETRGGTFDIKLNRIGDRCES